MKRKNNVNDDLNYGTSRDRFILLPFAFLHGQFYGTLINFYARENKFFPQRSNDL